MIYTLDGTLNGTIGWLLLIVFIKLHTWFSTSIGRLLYFFSGFSTTNNRLNWPPVVPFFWFFHYK